MDTDLGTAQKTYTTVIGKTLSDMEDFDVLKDLSSAANTLELYLEHLAMLKQKVKLLKFDCFELFRCNLRLELNQQVSAGLDIKSICESAKQDFSDFLHSSCCRNLSFNHKVLLLENLKHHNFCHLSSLIRVLGSKLKCYNNDTVDILHAQLSKVFNKSHIALRIVAQNKAKNLELKLLLDKLNRALIPCLSLAIKNIKQLYLQLGELKVYNGKLKEELQFMIRKNYEVNMALDLAEAQNHELTNKLSKLEVSLLGNMQYLQTLSDRLDKYPAKENYSNDLCILNVEEVIASKTTLSIEGNLETQLQAMLIKHGLEDVQLPFNLSLLVLFDIAQVFNSLKVVAPELSDVNNQSQVDMLQARQLLETIELSKNKDLLTCISFLKFKLWLISSALILQSVLLLVICSSGYNIRSQRYKQAVIAK